MGEVPGKTGKNSRFLLSVLFFFLFCFMGLRETCGDYLTYSYMVTIAESESFFENVSGTEVFYGGFNWLSSRLGWGIYGVNSFCAIVFLGCLYRGAVREPLPLFFVALSIPYFVIVVGMGYTRQGVAAGLILLGIQSLRFRNPGWFAIQIILAAGFHRSSLAVLPAILFSDLKYRSKAMKSLVRILILGIGAYGAFGLLREQFTRYVVHYVQSDHYQSGGAVLRTSVSGVAAIYFLTQRRRWQKQFGDTFSLMFFAIAALMSFPLAFVASTPADRIGLYLIPFQIIVFARIPCMQSNLSRTNSYRVGIAACYVVYFFVWLHLGTHSQGLWVPYKSALWGSDR